MFYLAIFMAFSLSPRVTTCADLCCKSLPTIPKKLMLFCLFSIPFSVVSFPVICSLSRFLSLGFNSISPISLLSLLFFFLSFSLLSVLRHFQVQRDIDSSSPLSVLLNPGKKCSYTYQKPTKTYIIKLLYIRIPS